MIREGDVVALLPPRPAGAAIGGSFGEVTACGTSRVRVLLLTDHIAAVWKPSGMRAGVALGGFKNKLLISLTTALTTSIHN